VRKKNALELKFENLPERSAQLLLALTVFLRQKREAIWLEVNESVPENERSARIWPEKSRLTDGSAADLDNAQGGKEFRQP